MTFLVVAIALVVGMLVWTVQHPPCAECGLPYDYPAHFLCRTHGTRCSGSHHAYRAPTWPSVLGLGLLVLDLAGFLVTR